MPDLEQPLTDEQLPSADASWQEILEETDWNLLRDQKKALSEIRAFLRKSKSNKIHHRHIDSIDGILELLDRLQDAAANYIGEDKVFGHRCACGEQLKNFLKQDAVGNGLTEIFGCPKCDS